MNTREARMGEREGANVNKIRAIEMAAWIGGSSEGWVTAKRLGFGADSVEAASAIQAGLITRDATHTEIEMTVARHEMGISLT